VALNRMKENRPVLILLDLMMPEMDGFEFLQVLRASEGYSDIPVIVVTARDLSDEDRTRLAVGVERVLQKGHYSRDELILQVRNLIGKFV
jgi:CheY-like chemotaxis protein